MMIHSITVKASKDATTPLHSQRAPFTQCRLISLINFKSLTLHINLSILLFLFTLLFLLFSSSHVSSQPISTSIPSSSLPTHLSSNHTNNWVIIVSTSRYWFNYRHVANALSIYHTVKQYGIPDSNIILMLPDNYPCNTRNIYPSTIYNTYDKYSRINLYSGDTTGGVEIDYRGEECSVENFLRLLTNKHPIHTPRSKRLLSDIRSHIFIYMTGHGGNEFLKFQDINELSAVDLADAIHQMYIGQRYRKLFLMVDTCQASTLHNRLSIPHTFAIGSSRKGENSYSHYHDDEIGVAVIDRFTSYTLDYMKHIDHYNHTFKQLFSSYQPHLLLSQPEYRYDMLNEGESLDSIKLTDFFGAISTVHLTNELYPMVPAPPSSRHEEAAEDVYDTHVNAMKQRVDQIVNRLIQSHTYKQRNTVTLESIDRCLHEIQPTFHTILPILPYINIQQISPIASMMLLFMLPIVLDCIISYTSMKKEAPHRRMKFKVL